MDGGSIRYVIEGDNSSLKGTLEESKKGMKGLSDVAKEAGQTMDDAFGATKENIKIQKEYILDLESQYKELQKTIDGMAPGRAKLSVMGDAANIAAEIEAEKKALVELESYVGSSTEKHKSLRQELYNVKSEMSALAAAGQEETEQYAELSQKANDYQNAIEKVNATMKAMNGSAALNAMVETLGLASAGMSIFQGMSAMAAGSNERLDEIMVKLQSTMSVAIGVQQLQNSLQKQSGVIQSVMALQALARSKAEDMAAASTGRATIAQRLFNVVAKANPYVLLAGAIISVVGALVLFSGKVNKAKKDQEDINKAVADGASEQIVQYKLLQTQWNALGDDLQKKKKFVEENKDKFHELGVEVNGVSDAENILVKNTSAVTDAIMLRAKAAAEAQLAQEEWKKVIQNQDQVNSNEKKYKEQGWQGKINKAVNDFGSDVLGIGGMSKGQLDEHRNNFDKFINDSVKHTQEAAEKISNAGIKAYTGFEKKEKNPAKSKTTAKQKADEFLPPGSVAEIQKRLSEIDKALSKATGEKQISDLKTKRIAIAKELAEAEKKIQIKSLQEQFDDSNKLWEQYYSAIASLGEEKAKEIYGSLLGNDASQFDKLQKMQQDLLSKSANGTLTDEEKDILNVVNEGIDQMLGKQSALDQFKQSLSDTLSGLNSDFEKLEYLQKIKAENDNGTSKSNGTYAAIVEQERATQEALKQTYNAILEEQKSYEEKSAELQKEYADVKKSDEYKNGTDAYRKKVDTHFKTAIGTLDMGMIQNTKEWEYAFSELEGMSNTSLQRILDKLLEFQQKSKGTLSLQDAAKLQEAIDKVKNAANSNPFQKVIASFTQYRDAVKNAKTSQQQYVSAQEKYNDAVAEFGEDSDEAKAALDKMNAAGDKAIEADKKQLDSKKKLIAGIDEAQGIFNAAGQGIMQIGDAFGGFDDATNDAIGDIMAIGNAAMDLGKSIASGDVAGMIKAGVQLIGSVFSALSGDKKRERNIKKWAAAVNELKNKYTELAYAVEKALGTEKYDNQNSMIKNLKEQQSTLQKMYNEESKKKKKDQGKLDDYKNQIADINRQIQDITDDMVSNILQTDVKSLADSLGDALLAAWQKGASGADAYKDVAKKAMQDAVLNALKMSILEPQLKAFTNQMLSAMGYTVNSDGTLSGSFDGLTSQEQQNLQDMMGSVYSQFENAMSAYGDLFGQGETANDSLEGAIKGVSEETASIIAGQMNAIRVNQGQMLVIQQQSFDVIRNQLLELTKIEYNTRYIYNLYQSFDSLTAGLRAKGLV